MHARLNCVIVFGGLRTHWIGEGEHNNASYYLYSNCIPYIDGSAFFTDAQSPCPQLK